MTDNPSQPGPLTRLPRSEVPAPDVRRFRARLRAFFDATDEQGRRWANATWGVYAFYDYDGEPIYVGQTNEQLRTRIRRHLTNQRTDAVAMRVLDIFEVAEVEVFPIWELQGTPRSNADAKQWLNALEYSVYLHAIENSRFKAILNEKIPPVSTPIELPPSLRFDLIDQQTRLDSGHPDIRIARRAETISRLAAVARERGKVSDGLRRVLVIQAVRLAYLAASRLAEVEGRPQPDPDAAFDIESLVGSVLYESEDASEGAGDEDSYED